VQRVVNPNRGGAVTGLTVPHPEGETLYTIREGVESQWAAAIETRYKVEQGAPILQDTCLHSNFGFLPNTYSADHVLQGSYVYPRIWMHIPKFSYRRHRSSFTDFWRRR
jgi:hypothetical protein